MPSIQSARVLILAADGYERCELRVPYERLAAMGATVTVASLERGQIRSWDQKNWGDVIDVDVTVAEAMASDFDALIIPGGQIDPDLLGKENDAVKLIRDFVASGKPVAAICHGPWLLAEAGVLKGRAATAYETIRPDLVNAGAKWQDREVVADHGIITSRCPADLDAFVARIIAEIEQDRPTRRAA